MLHALRASLDESGFGIEDVGRAEGGQSCNALQEQVNVEKAAAAALSEAALNISDRISSLQVFLRDNALPELATVRDETQSIAMKLERVRDVGNNHTHNTEDNLL